MFSTKDDAEARSLLTRGYNRKASKIAVYVTVTNNRYQVDESLGKVLLQIVQSLLNVLTKDDAEASSLLKHGYNRKNSKIAVKVTVTNGRYQVDESPGKVLL